MTIYDIAKIAGVSKSTVSRVINNDKSVKETTRLKIQEIIKEHNFRPNKSAIDLNGPQRKTYLVIVTTLDSYYETRVLKGMVEEDNNENDFIIMECKHSFENTIALVTKYSYVDGLIIFSLNGYEYDFLKDFNIPYYLVGHHFENAPSMYYDDKKATELLFNEMVKKDTKSILYFGYLDINTRMGKIRNDTITALCKENNIELSLLYLNDSKDSKQLLAAMQKVDEYDLILCASDEMALYVYIHTLGEKLFGGMGNNANLSHYFTDYTTISFGYKESGKKIMNELQNNTLKTIKMDASLVKIRYEKY